MSFFEFIIRFFIAWFFAGIMCYKLGNYGISLTDTPTDFIIIIIAAAMISAAWEIGR